MNWKREACDKLRDYRAKKEAVENIVWELRRLEAESTRLRSASTDAVAARGSDTNAREDWALNNIAHRDELRSRLREARIWVATVDRALDTLDDEERRVLEVFFIDRVPAAAARLTQTLHLEKSRVYEIRDRALRRFTLALYGNVES